MGPITIYTTVILTGLMILLIGLNEMVTVAIIIIKAVGVDQANGAVDGLQLWIQTLQRQTEKNLQAYSSIARELLKLSLSQF